MSVRCGVDVGSMRGRCGVDVRSIIIYEGERLVTLPSPIFFIKEALPFLKFSLLSERVRFKLKKCGTVIIITTTFFNKVLEIMKTARKAISPEKAKSLA